MDGFAAATAAWARMCAAAAACWAASTQEHLAAKSWRLVTKDCTSVAAYAASAAARCATAKADLQVACNLAVESINDACPLA